MGPAVITLNIVFLIIGLKLARGAGFVWAQAKTISIETGVQNGALGITLAVLIVPQNTGGSTLALPSAVYGITMYLIAVPFVLGYRNC